jgi:pimeloyl-ACP methyl ester carboxylesterase
VGSRAEPGSGRTSLPPQPHDEGRIERVRTQDGLQLAVRIFDVADCNLLPLLCLAGLSRNSRDFIPIGRHFARRAEQPRRVIAIDYRGRGLSQSDPDWRNYRPLVEAQDVLTVAAALGIERAIVIGTSRGGIIAMLIGALRPALLAGVVLNDIGPVLEGTGLARIKAYLANRRAVASWDEATALVRSFAQAQFPGLSSADWTSVARAYFAESPSGLAPQYDPALRNTVVDIDVTGKLPALWPQFASLAQIPVLAIRGEFSDLLSPDTLAAMAERHQDLKQFTVPGQGHPPLLSDEPTLSRITSFVAGCGGETRAGAEAAAKRKQGRK